MTHQQTQPQGWTPIEDSKRAAGFAVFAARALAAPVEVCIRRRFGSRYFGVPALVGCLLVPTWMVFWPRESALGITAFWFVYLFNQLAARVESVRMAARGDIMHSRYNGRPMLCGLFPRMSERAVKASVEPVLVIAAGALAMAPSPPLGSYLIAAGVALAITHAVAAAVDRARAMELHDSFLEQRDLAERFREMTGRRS